MPNATNLVAEEQILGLDVPVNHVLLVAIVQRISKGANVLRAAALTKPTATLVVDQVAIQLAVRRILQNEVHSLLVPEVAKQAQDVLVAVGVDIPVSTGAWCTPVKATRRTGDVIGSRSPAATDARRQP